MSGANVVGAKRLQGNRVESAYDRQPNNYLTLQEGNTAQTSVYPGTEGGNVTVSCRYPSPGTWKYFCKGEYGRHNVLIRTVDDTAQSGRYSIRYVEEPRAAVLNVTITQLTKSDSGLYGCGLDRTELLYEAFEVIVVNASASPAFPEITDQSGKTSNVTDRVMLYVGLTLVFMVVLLFVVWLIFCRKRKCKPEEPPVENEYASITEANPTYKEIREVDRQSRSPPVGISSVYTYAKYTKPNGVETSDTTASSQHGVQGSSDANHARDDPPLYSTVTLHQQ